MRPTGGTWKKLKAMALATDVTTASRNPHTVETDSAPTVIPTASGGGFGRTSQDARRAATIGPLVAPAGSDTRPSAGCRRRVSSGCVLREAHIDLGWSKRTGPIPIISGLSSRKGTLVG